MNDFINMLNDEQKQALLKALVGDSQTLSSIPQEVKKESIKQIQSSTPPASVNEDFTMFKQESTSNTRRKEQVRARKNEWQDTGEFRDVETPQFEKTPRRRQPHKKVEVECHVCGKTFKEDARFVHGDYYRCNRCTGK
jgi:formylmethanofuran dehydrogenase subunit E